MSNLEKIVEIHNEIVDSVFRLDRLICNRDIREHILIALELLADEIDELRLEEDE